jgi:hypothetical protein
MDDRTGDEPVEGQQVPHQRAFGLRRHETKNSLGAIALAPHRYQRRALSAIG